MDSSQSRDAAGKFKGAQYMHFNSLSPPNGLTFMPGGLGFGNFTGAIFDQAAKGVT